MDENLGQRAYSHIIEKLANGDLPPGSRLSNRVLASEIGVSVIPVREAISRLESEGFVQHRAGVGSFVPTPTYEELMDLYDLREAVECHAVKKSGAMLTEELLGELSHYVDVWTEILDNLERAGGLERDRELLEQWSLTDALFHDAIVSASGNRRALETARNLRKMSRIFGTRVGGQPLAMLRRSLESHRRIVDALRCGDVEEAARLLAEHIQYGCRRILEIHRSNRTRRPSDSVEHRGKRRKGALEVS
jgi:DNA-binding GntR family transcriptional regulator